MSQTDRNASRQPRPWVVGWYVARKLNALQGVMILVGTVLIVLQVRQANEFRRQENFMSGIERMVDHNWNVYSDRKTRQVVASMEDLRVGSDEEEQNSYWASRIVHLSHINLLWNLWELEGRPDPSKVMSTWGRFAQLEAKELAGAKPGTPEGRAAADLWKGLHDYEIHPVEFVEFLDLINASE